MSTDQDRQRDEESKRILTRLSQEEGAGGLGGLSAAMRSAREKVAPPPPDGADTIEYWGTRIGRGLGFLITLAIVGWLLVYLLGWG